MKPYLLTIIFLCVLTVRTFAQSTPTEDDYYKIITLPVPENMLLEVGGLTTLPDGRLALCTRRGEVWLVENPNMARGSLPKYSLFASGLHEPLGLAWKDNALYTAQRGELTKLTDNNGDDNADSYETIYAWPLSGHYHEYSYGPKFAPDGSMFVTGNVAFGDEEWWRGESRVPWRGWTMRITPDGEMEPWATGQRSPCGLGMIDGELFYTDNQGDWMGSGGLWHVKKGSFMGHPAGLRWADKPGSPVTITPEAFNGKIDERRERREGHAVKPENIQDENDPLLLYEAKATFPQIQLPAVWLPHGILGISNSEIVQDLTKGSFGPFEGQLFIGDQGQSKIMRVALEKINGVYQGVAFDFKGGFQSGVLRMSWGNDGSLFVGETNRGWGSAGNTSSGLQRLMWTGKIPMEMHSVNTMPDGFEITFTRPVDRQLAEDLSSYRARSFLYKYHPVYGSPPVDDQEVKIRGVKVSDDGMRVRLVTDDLRKFHIHHLNVQGLKSANGTPVLHPDAYYTLNEIAEGSRLPASELSTRRTASAVSKKPVTKKTPSSGEAALTFDMIKPLLDKNTCTACHQTANRQVGPSFTEIAKRKYSNEKMVDLIYNPQPANWPGYATEMAPMPQVPRDEALKIADWINSLREGD